LSLHIPFQHFLITRIMDAGNITELPSINVIQHFQRTDSYSADETAAEPYDILSDPRRINVQFCMSLHDISREAGSDKLQFHLVLKFYYKKEHMVYFMNPDDIPSDDIEVIKEYGSPTRYFPFMIFNSVEESPVNWSYFNKQKAGNIYERIELFATLTNVSFERYSPFVLRLLNIKVGTDGTFKAGQINLIPKPGSTDNAPPQIDFGVFSKATSLYTLPVSDEGGISVNQADSSAFSKMFIRDLTVNPKGNLCGIYTRVYTCLFFESSYMENLFKYIVLSTVLSSLFLFTTNLELHDLLGVDVALILTEVALLFVLRETAEFTTSERVLVSHTISMITMTILTASGVLHNRLLIAVTIGIIVAGTLLFVLYEYHQFYRLVSKLKAMFYANGEKVGSFVEIDGII